MKPNDTYLHYKGGKYIYKYIALPLRESHRDKAKIYQGSVTHHEGGRLQLYSHHGTVYIDADVPHVLYATSKQDTTEAVIYAREVDDFFCHLQLEDGSYVKRFTLERGEIDLIK